MKAILLLSRNLRRIRVEQDISQEDLAVDAGVDRTYVGKIERGKENPSVANLDKIAKALSVPIAEFFKEPKPGERAPKPLKSGRKPRP